jgi:GMP synthase-like glutamine amidotransferase
MLTLVQNDPEVPSGRLLDVLQENHVPHRVISPFKGEALPSFDGALAVIILGGAMGVHEADQYPYLASVRACIKHAVDHEIPLLGICLGGQLLAETLGATVHSRKNGEMGICSVEILNSACADPLFDGIPEVFTTFQWHNDSFEIPDGAVCLASSRDCPHQAFRYGDSQYGLQFHPEVTRNIVTSWAMHADGTLDSAKVLEDFLQAEKTYSGISRKLLENFLRLALIID